jgi:hypothetical protein
MGTKARLKNTGKEESPCPWQNQTPVAQHIASHLTDWAILAYIKHKFKLKFN